jgi:GNAT superfamily N-acetyltransferase
MRRRGRSNLDLRGFGVYANLRCRAGASIAAPSSISARQRRAGTLLDVTLLTLTWAERPDLAERGPLAEAVWPEYNLHGDVFDDWWMPLLEELPEYQFALYDDAADAVLAEGHTGPLAWNGNTSELPDGIDDALQRVVLGARASRPVDTLCAFAAEVDPTARQGGLAAELLRAMLELARRKRLGRLIAPVRPSWKERYPLAPIERYITWRREDGQLLDPWMRLHERLGARVATALPHSMRITGTVRDWETWTGLPFPESGSYVFPRGLAPLIINRETDSGTYWEPNVWMIHRELA